ncbi:homoserine kinase, partial [Haematococcus lacustris]
VVLIDKIEGDKGRLSLDPAKNCIGIAAQETLKLLGPVTCGVGLTLHKPGVVLIDKIEGDKGRLSLDPAKNCIGIAAQETLKLLGPVTCGVGLTLHKVLGL